ncbi:hypothetical protein [Neisseria blantyrii]|uniref:hypothetical protein n=1 Tax=Neisseria blantyrii TaxID=2830647 RepID=UPI00272D26AD|nr:hypothetical protein [Neisseria blantyrii]
MPSEAGFPAFRRHRRPSLQTDGSGGSLKPGLKNKRWRKSRFSRRKARADEPRIVPQPARQGRHAFRRHPEARNAV